MFVFIGSQKINEFKELFDLIHNEIKLCRNELSVVNKKLEIYKNEQEELKYSLLDAISRINGKQEEADDSIKKLSADLFLAIEKYNSLVVSTNEKYSADITTLWNGIEDVSKVVEDIKTTTYAIDEKEESMISNILSTENKIITELKSVKDSSLKESKLLNDNINLNIDNKFRVLSEMNNKNFLELGIKASELGNTMNKVKEQIAGLTENSVVLQKNISDIETKLVTGIDKVDECLDNVTDFKNSILESNNSMDEHVSADLQKIGNNITNQLMQVDESIRLLLINTILDEINLKE